jgi:hypothetical protein
MRCTTPALCRQIHTNGDTSYGGGRYALDTDLGGTASTLVIDLNFLYHPDDRTPSARTGRLSEPRPPDTGLRQRRKPGSQPQPQVVGGYGGLGPPG